MTDPPSSPPRSRESGVGGRGSGVGFSLARQVPIAVLRQDGQPDPRPPTPDSRERRGGAGVGALPHLLRIQPPPLLKRRNHFRLVRRIIPAIHASQLLDDLIDPAHEVLGVFS